LSLLLVGKQNVCGANVHGTRYVSDPVQRVSPAVKLVSLRQGMADSVQAVSKVRYFLNPGRIEAAPGHSLYRANLMVRVIRIVELIGSRNWTMAETDLQ
jgi:hypothetical protein